MDFVAKFLYAHTREKANYFYRITIHTESLPVKYESFSA